MATPIEQHMNRADKMNYMYSLNASGDSNTTLIVNFDITTDPNTDLILAQSRQTQAASQLPADVTNYRVTVRKSVTAPLMWIVLYSPKGTYDAKLERSDMAAGVCERENQKLLRRAVTAGRRARLHECC